MNLRHGTVDSPGAPDHAPLAYKFVPGFAQGGSRFVLVIHVVSVNPETTVCQINSWADSGLASYGAPYSPATLVPAFMSFRAKRGISRIIAPVIPSRSCRPTPVSSPWRRLLR